jgi:hypothetical protein
LGNLPGYVDGRRYKTTDDADADGLLPGFILIIKQAVISCVYSALSAAEIQAVQ